MYLYERFRMSLTYAGFSATFYVQAAACILIASALLLSTVRPRTEDGTPAEDPVK